MNARGSAIDRFRAGFGHTALGPAVVIWGFGYILVDIIGFLLGRNALGLSLLVSLPMFALGVSQTLALDGLRKASQRRGPALRWPVMMIAIVAATALQALFDLHWLRWVSIALLPHWQEWALMISLQRLFTVAVLYLWTFCLAMTLLWAARVSSAAAASAARAATAEAAAAKAEATALRLQLNPHFMFNALNSISSLVLLDRKAEAEEMIARLCEFLRGSLQSDPMADVPLAQEIDSIDAYLSIEAARFGDDLDVAIDVGPGITDSPIPNFILQPLVENAIKHGVAAVRSRTSVTVAATREGEALVLSVVNSLPAGAAERMPGRNSAIAGRPRAGIGLDNIRQRLVNRYGKDARLETGPTSDGYRAVIRLPFVDLAQEDAGAR